MLVLQSVGLVEIDRKQSYFIVIVGDPNRVLSLSITKLVIGPTPIGQKGVLLVFSVCQYVSKHFSLKQLIKVFGNFIWK